MTEEGQLSTFTIVDVLAHDSDDPFGDGFFPLYPTVGKDRAVISLEGESPVRTWSGQAFRVFNDDRAVLKVPKMEVHLTSQRLVFRQRWWKQHVGLLDAGNYRALSTMIDTKHAVQAGHIPLESVFSVTAAVCRKSYIKVVTMGAFTGGRYFSVYWDLSSREIIPFMRSFMAASKERWLAYDLPPATQEAIQAEGTSDSSYKAPRPLGRVKESYYEQPLVVPLNKKATMALKEGLEAVQDLTVP